MNRSTDWDAYYTKPARLAHFSRSVTRKRIVRLLREHVDTEPVSFCEYGGANSCVATAICKAFNASRYMVVDTNAYGIALLRDLKTTPEIVTWQASVLDDPAFDEQDRCDVVFSIGLIEHFAKGDTESAIRTHFKSCRPGGVVLLTFPTPTQLYLAIRHVAELAGQWAFPDERPLTFAEVRKTTRNYGTILHQSINWKIGLTQGYVLARCHDD